MLVDLGRNDLGRVARAGTVAVSKYMEVERYSHVLHLVSHVEGRLRPGLDALDALRSVFPAGTLSGAPEGPGDAADRGGRRRAARAVRRRGRLPRLRRQPRHRDHDPERGPQGRPGPRPHRRGDRRGLRARARVRGDRAQGGAPSAGRSSSPQACRRPRARRGDGSGARDVGPEPGRDPGHRQLRQLHLQPRPGARGGRGGRCASSATTPSTVGAVAALADDPAADLRGIVISPGPGDPDDAGISVDAVGVAAERGTPAARRLPGDAVRWPRRSARRSSGRRRSCTARRPRSPTTAPACWPGMPPAVHGRALPLAGGRPGDPAARAAGHRDERGGPGGHGDPPRRAPARGRPVPPRVGADAGGPAPPRQLPAPGRRGRGVAARRRRGLVRDGRPGRAGGDR